MKKIKNIFLSMLILVFTATSCTKTLDLAPEDYFGDGNFWKNESQVNNFMVGMHKQFRDNQFMFLRLGEMRSGNFSNVDRQNTSLNELQIIEQRIDETSTGISNWAGFYSPILQLNLFITRVSAITFLSDARKQYLLGQAYGMRAFYYYQLLRTYGGVPLRLEPEVLTGNTDPVKLRKARATEAEVLTAIKTDVNKSVASFGSAASPTDKSLWSPKASLMLKGDVYLWSAKVYSNNADLAEAKTALNLITGNALQTSFSNVFAFGQKNNSEVIFSIRYLVGEAEMGAVAQFLYSTFNFDNLHYKDSLASGPLLVDPLIIAAPNAQQVIQRYGYTFDLFASYDVTDKRRNATFYDYYKVTASGAKPYKITIRNTAMVKFLGTISANKRYFTDDWPVYREADRLLMLAEIVNAEGGDPTTYIKQIRDRAFLPVVDPKPFVSSTKDANELAIFAERNKEFVHEGKAWYDLRRMKYGSDPLVFISTSHKYGVLNKSTFPYKILWPIEPTIWTNDPLVNQTPGYASTKPQ